MRWVILLSLPGLVLSSLAPAAELAMGFRVGEVKRDSALVWTRITRFPERRKEGFREAERIEPVSADFVPYATPIDEREGAVPGAPGQARVRYSSGGGDTKITEWFAANEENDFCLHIPLASLAPGAKVDLIVEARNDERSPITATLSGSFSTPAPAGVWQDVRLGVVTCQSYWHRDREDGFQIYQSLAAMDLDFVCSTGDSVYLDLDAPRARTVDLARFHWQRMYSLPLLVDFFSRVPGYWELDDHDAIANDCWPGRKFDWMSPLTFDEGARVFREYNPVSDPLYRTIRWGQVLQVWLVDARQYRSPSRRPDGPEKSIWGVEQREWLERTLLESDAAFKLLISPTPIVGPDREDKSDNHANRAFAHEGDRFRRFTQEHRLENLFVICGDRHWQYLSTDPTTGLREFACGPASDEHASGAPEVDPSYQSFFREKGGYLSATITQEDGQPTIYLRHHDVKGEVVNEFVNRR